MATPTEPVKEIFDPADINKDGYVSEEEFRKAYPDRVSAYDLIVNEFNQYGVGEIGQWIKDTLSKDPTLLDRPSELNTKLYESKPYSDRFSGLVKIREFNADESKKAAKDPTYVPNYMVVLSEGEYLRTETIYKQVLAPVISMYGDDLNAEIGKIIANNISPVELQNRVGIAQQWVDMQDPLLKEQLRKWYTIGDNELLKFALNPERGLAEIQKAAGAAQLGAQAVASAVSLNKEQSEALIQALVRTGASPDLLKAGQKAAETLQDITSGTATAYNPNAGSLVGTQQLAKIEGTDITGQEVLGAALGVNTEAASKIRGLKAREKARFEGASGGTNVLGQQVSGTV